MNRRSFASVVTALLVMAVLLVLLTLMAGAGPDVPQPAQAAPLLAVPTLTDVDPSSAPNDLDTPIVVTGTGFAVSATVQLGSASLDDAGWVSTTTLTATVPWGLDPGVYTLTVTNPGEGSGSLPNAFTVTQGIGVWNAGELYGGSVDLIVINPVTPTTLYAIADGAGLFCSRDGGESWSFKVSGASDLAIDPVSPNRVYIVGYPHSGGGLYRSDDEGETWIPLTATFPITQTSGVDCWRAYRLYTNSGTVYATACGRDGDDSGLIASTNHGETWTPLMGSLTDTQVTALAFHPVDPLTMHAGTGNGHVFRSTDGGASWIYASQPVSYVRDLAVNPFGSHEVWVSGEDWLGDPGTLLKSANADLTAWTVVEPEPGATMSATSIDFAPTISGTVFVARSGRGHKTTDGGNTWTLFQPEGAGFVGDLALHPTDPDTVYLAGRREGVYKTTDGGLTWQVVNHGLTAIFPSRLEVVPDRPDTVFAVVDPGRAFRAAQGGEVWQALPITDASCVLVDPVTTTRVYAGGGERVYISDDLGDTWPTYGQLAVPPQYAEYNFNVFTLLALPGQPVVLLAGVSHASASGGVVGKGSIYRSTDAGLSWDRVYPLVGEIGQLADLAYDHAFSTTVYAGTWGSGIHKSTDGGQTWQRVGAGVAALDNAQSVAPEPHAPYRLVVATDGDHGLYLSPNHGLTWTQVSPDNGCWVGLLWTPEYPSKLYVPMNGGLHRSTDAGASWQAAAGTLGQVPVYSVDAVTATDRVILYAGTTGGVVESTSARAWHQGDTANSTLVSAGVYRWTTRITRVYLPLAFKEAAP